MESDLKEKKRQTKTTQGQYLIYVSFIEENRSMCTKKGSDKAIEGLWDKLKNLLNSGTGPQRTTQAWKKIFENWRNALRHKKRRLSLHLNATGGGPESDEILKDIEERALNAWGNIVIEGVCVTESGFANSTSDSPPVAQPGEQCKTQTAIEIHPNVTKPKRRKPSNDDEILNKILKIEDKKSQTRLDGDNTVAEALKDIAESINNLAEVIYNVFAKK